MRSSMRRSLRGVLGLLAAVGVVALLQPIPNGMADATKDYPLCVQACNTARALCSDQCKDDCGALFPDDKPSRDACIAACKAVCSDQSDDCKAECLEIKDGGSPPEP